MNALVGGQVDYMCDQIVNAVPQIKGGTIKAVRDPQDCAKGGGVSRPFSFARVLYRRSSGRLRGGSGRGGKLRPVALSRGTESGRCGNISN